MAVIEITSIDDATFEFKKGIIIQNKPKVYVAELVNKDYVRVEQVSTEHSDLFNPIIYTDLLIDGVIPTSGADAVSKLNAIVFSKAEGGGSAITTETVTENVAIGDALYLNSSDTYSKADALFVAKSSTKVVIALEVGTAGSKIKVSTKSNLVMAGLLADKTYYIAEGGGITHDTSTFQSGSIYKIIGYTGDGTTLHISVDETHTQYGAVNGLNFWMDNVEDLQKGKASGGTSPTWEDTGNGLYAYSFSASNQLQVSFHINHKYVEGTNGYPHIHWFSQDALAIGESAVWEISYLVARGHSQGDSLTEILTAFQVTHTATGVQIAGDHNVTEASLAQSFDLLEPDTIVKCIIKLISKSFAGKIYGEKMDLHYLARLEGTANKTFPFN